MLQPVFYSPRGAGGFHPVRPARPKGAWQSIARFLQECETVAGPTQCRLIALGGLTQYDDVAAAAKCIERTIERFGPPTQSQDHYVSSAETGEALSGPEHQWEVPPERFAEFRDYVLAGDPWPRQTIGPVTFRFTYTFQWRDPDGSGPLPEQLRGHATPDGQLRSMLEVSLAPKSRVCPALWFPFSHDDPGLRDLLSFVVPILPFRISPRNFMLGIPRKDGKGYHLRRFDASELTNTSND